MSFARKIGLLLALAFLLVLPARAYVLEGQKWPNGNIVMNVQMTGVVNFPLPTGGLADGSASWNAVAQAALADWNLYLLNVQFTFNNNVVTTSQSDGINSVFFNSTFFGSSFGSGTLGITGRSFTGSTTLASDTVINTAYQWDSYRGNLQPNAQHTAYIFDIRRVLDHELGHNLGLNHPDLATPAQTVTAIMNSVTSNLDHIEVDDIQGIFSMYGVKTMLEPVTVVASPANEGSVSGGGNLQLAAVKTLTATPASGYAFVQWEDFSTNPTRSITVGLQGGTYTATFAPDNQVWTNELPTTNEGLQNILYVNGGFIAFGGGFGVDTSPDGVTWTVHQPTGAGYYPTAVAYHAGKYVSVGSSGQVTTSPDGLAWTSHNTTFTSASFNGVTSGNGQYVAVGQSSDPNAPTPIMTSPDGLTWTLQTQVYSGITLNSVAYADGIYVAVGEEGNTAVAMTSPDGVVWGLQFITSPANPVGFTNLVYGHGVFEASATNGGTLFASADGVTWTRTASLAAYPFSIAYGNGTFFAESYQSGGFSTEYSYLVTSPDGINWQYIFPVTPVSDSESIAFGGGRAVTVGLFGIFATPVFPAITAPVLPVVNSVTASGVVNKPFTFQIAGTNSPLAFNAIGLPAGFTVDVPSGTITGTPGVTGTFPVTLFATNDAGSGTATLTITVAAGATPQLFADWATAHNVTGGMSATPRNDGIPNLLKYLYDIDPTVPVTVAARASLPVEATASSGTQLTLTFPENRILENVGVVVQTSTDLVAWSTPGSATITATGTMNSNGDPIMVAQVPVTANIQFIRLVVTPQ